MTDALARERKSHIWDRHPDDWYVEDRLVSERLFASGALAGCRTVLDPACGLGRIVHSAAKAGFRAAGTDIAPRQRDRHTQAIAKRPRTQSAGFRPAPPQRRASTPLERPLPPRRPT